MLLEEFLLLSYGEMLLVPVKLSYSPVDSIDEERSLLQEERIRYLQSFATGQRRSGSFWSADLRECGICGGVGWPYSKFVVDIFEDGSGKLGG